MKKVLIVSFFFPPTNAIGAIRVGKFAKYLGDFGWEPWVLTMDSSLLNVSEDLPVEIPSERVVRSDFGRIFTAVVRGRKPRNAAPAGVNPAPAREPRARFRVRLPGIFSDSRLPDRAFPWYLPALRAGEALVSQHAFGAVLSSHGPPASSIVGSILAGRHRLPWVADFRDLWTQNHAHRGRPGPIHRLEQRIETRVMRSCRTMITVSLPLKRELEQLHGKPVTVIPNGFDEEEYAGAARTPRRDGLRIVYTGMIYEGKQDPSPLFRAVRELIDAGTLGSHSIRIEFYGANPAFVMAQAAAAGVPDVVEAAPRIPQALARARQLDADVLLLLDWIVPGIQGYASGKVFEYFGARKPILAIGPRGSVIEGLLRETRAGVLATSSSDVKAALEKWLAARSSTGILPYEGDSGAVNRYSRRVQTGALARVLDSVAREGDSSP